MISSVHTLLDFTAPPSKVIECCEIFSVKALKADAKNQHWLVQIFDLDKGKKIIETALENARSRQASSDILDDLAAASAELEGYNLHDVLRASKGEYDRKDFTVDFAKSIVSAITATKSEGHVVVWIG